MRHRRRHAKTPPPHPIPHQKSKTFPLLITTVALWLILLYSSSLTRITGIFTVRAVFACNPTQKKISLITFHKNYLECLNCLLF
jgi:hypothetical protein